MQTTEVMKVVKVAGVVKAAKETERPVVLKSSC
jgi:hypothetical protein